MPLVKWKKFILSSISTFCNTTILEATMLLHFPFPNQLFPHLVFVQNIFLP